MEVVNIRDRTDMLSVDGIERPDKERGGTAKWRMALTAKWNVAEGVYLAASGRSKIWRIRSWQD